ncbi:MAG: hypothetical protein QOH06_4489 [Acidobacteriota bacterium]|nr:hypothetical protein [Acidobacteriota bacterium]
MSCPDWTALTAHRLDKRGGAEPEGWSEALAHFDGGCQLCRKAALKSDPTLVFRRLAQVPAVTMTEAQERSEVDSVRQAVAAMRAASRLEKGRRRGVLLAGGWKRWSAAAALALITVTVPSDDVRRTAQLRETPMATEVLDLSAARQTGDAPVVEGGVDMPGTRVYHLGGDKELSVVMFVNESFDESYGG